MNEELLSYFWKLQRFPKENLCTTDGEPISVIYPGLLNRDGGPDFLHARIRIGQTLWVGNVELHVKSSDWEKHGHSNDPVYDNVILHVVYQHDKELNLPFPELALDSFLDQRTLLQAEDWQKSLNPIPCSANLVRQPDIMSIAWKERLLIERLETHSATIRVRIDQLRGNLEEAFLQTLAHYFGMKVNSLPFEMLARTIPLKALRKYSHHREEAEALFFGQAGMLQGRGADGFHSSLRERYRYQKSIYHLEEMDASYWKYLRLRPANFPSRRISQLASLYCKSPNLLQEILDCHRLEDLENILHVTAHVYWEDHVRFGQPCRHSKAELGVDTRRHLLGNAVLPFLFVIAEIRAMPELRENVLEMFHELPAENNRLMKQWKERGVLAKSFGESQGLIHLYTDYCQKKKCLDCQVGVKILQSRKNLME
ncbi:MAG: DUF2851 family protein [Bacteroidetes bacterium]|nr:DUF2851 family protein [Bacteroidota bacterium]